MSGPALLDINLLIAMLDPTHVHHQLAHEWFADSRGRGWATCPVTENGFVRILSLAMPDRPAIAPGILATHLQTMCSDPGHVFWPDRISLSDPARFDLSAARHRQLIDIYLLGLAHLNGGTLATFDRTIPVNTVIGATRDTLEVIGAEQP